jgi:hypothetical protein
MYRAIQIEYKPSWWPFATQEKEDAAILAALEEFGDGIAVELEPDGMRVTVTGLADHDDRGASVRALRMLRQLAVAVEYKICEFQTDYIDMKEVA